MQAISAIGAIMGYVFSFFSYGTGAYTQYQNLALQRQQAAQRQAQVMHCDPGLCPTVIDNHDGTYSAVCVYKPVCQPIP
jgi:hypothetical protein